ncbi:MAG: ATP-binding protein [Acidimicrobiales bacterium]
MAVAALAETLFGLPLATALRHRESYRDRRELTELVALAADRAVGGRLVVRSLARPPEPNQQLGLYDLTGQRVDGLGPQRVETTAAGALDNQVVETKSRGLRVVTVPLVDQGRVTGIVRGAEPLSAGASRVHQAWWRMAALGVGSLLLSAAAGFALARRLTRPLDGLGWEASRIGEGDFTITTRRTGIPEIDRVGENVSRTAERVSSLLAREQAFTADASHQLRSPLSGLRLTLEAELAHPRPDSREAITQALADVERLETTIDSLLALARDTAVERAPVDLAVLLDDLAGRWRPSFDGSGRRLVFDAGVDSGFPTVSGAALSHVLDVLVDNARRHGAGDVVVRTRTNGAAVSVAVSDEGPGVEDPVGVFERRGPGAGGTGIGLALARRLTEAEGGRLRVRSGGGGATFEVTLPVETPLAREIR